MSVKNLLLFFFFCLFILCPNSSFLFSEEKLPDWKQAGYQFNRKPDVPGNSTKYLNIYLPKAYKTDGVKLPYIYTPASVAAMELVKNGRDHRQTTSDGWKTVCEAFGFPFFGSYQIISGNNPESAALIKKDLELIPQHWNVNSKLVVYAESRQEEKQSSAYALAHPDEFGVMSVITPNADPSENYSAPDHIPFFLGVRYKSVFKDGIGVQMQDIIKKRKIRNYYCLSDWTSNLSLSINQMYAWVIIEGIMNSSHISETDRDALFDHALNALRTAEQSAVSKRLILEAYIQSETYIEQYGTEKIAPIWKDITLTLAKNESYPEVALLRFSELLMHPMMKKILNKDEKKDVKKLLKEKTKAAGKNPEKLKSFQTYVKIWAKEQGAWTSNKMNGSTARSFADQYEKVFKQFPEQPGGKQAEIRMLQLRAMLFR